MKMVDNLNQRPTVQLFSHDNKMGIFMSCRAKKKKKKATDSPVWEEWQEQTGSRLVFEASSDGTDSRGRDVGVLLEFVM